MQHRRTIWAAATLGFALSGFFDGILLHQILQWHHLLSLVPGIDNIRSQILWDGWFHAAMYVISLIGLIGLWRLRGRPGLTPRRVAGAMLAGFGTWHAVDAVLSHWLLGIHRIRLDSDWPILWDLGWLAVFGILPLAGGILLLRHAPAGPGKGPGLVALLALLAVGAGSWALRPPPGLRSTAVVFSRSVAPDQMTDSLTQAGASILWADAVSRVAIVDLPPGRGIRLYAQGALMVAGSGLPAGCFSWSRPGLTGRAKA
ncbi:DUF2243 domain-containing protein [Paracoccus rhizosphaerae]|uniref:DUF2243 domain-containing protein n=1 Tax=Paracoccus rhizosphaerae TaxID=1133347 RepID=A0ABV6CEG7_9RHOB|nr:DUF2243 domain-containing protein [Paracoccus rhizosphaerae]